MADVRVRWARQEDALVVAALALQCARHRGGAGEPGFLDRYASAWLSLRDDRPVWIAEAADQHAGFLQAAMVRPLPWPGAAPGRGSTLVIEVFFVRPEHRGVGAGERLLGSAVEWARDAGCRRVSMAAGPHTRPMVQRLGFRASESEMVMEL